MIKVGVVGATGYAGVELVRLLLNHPKVHIAAVGSESFKGQQLSALYPSLENLVDLPLVSTPQVIEASDLIFLSLPHGLSEEIAKDCLGKGKKVIDLGADFRLDSEQDYHSWYGAPFKLPQLHKGVPYGLPELFREEIKGSSLVANPGCYPTAIALGLAPLMKEGLGGSVIIDAKSGVTGAGKSLSDLTHFPQCNETLTPYKIGTHRHTPEIEQTLSRLSGRREVITFTPHLVPVNRGILATMYTTPTRQTTLDELYNLYKAFYKEEFFVRLMPLGKVVTMNQVRGSNYCDISLHLDERTGRILVVSAIDNMVKGAAGQGIQNMNILYSLPENTGLNLVPFQL